MFSGHGPGPLSALAFSAMGCRFIADTGTAKSGPALATAQAKWPFLALWPLDVASGMPVSAPQFPTQVDPRQTGPQDIGESSFCIPKARWSLQRLSALT